LSVFCLVQFSSFPLLSPSGCCLLHRPFCFFPLQFCFRVCSDSFFGLSFQLGATSFCLLLYVILFFPSFSLHLWLNPSWAFNSFT
jgi:hypothetical protein